MGASVPLPSPQSAVCDTRLSSALRRRSRAAARAHEGSEFAWWAGDGDVRGAGVDGRVLGFRPRLNQSALPGTLHAWDTRSAPAGNRARAVAGIVGSLSWPRGSRSLRTTLPLARRAATSSRSHPARGLRAIRQLWRSYRGIDPRQRALPGADEVRRPTPAHGCQRVRAPFVKLNVSAAQNPSVASR